MAIDKQNNRHTISPQTHIVFIMTRSKKGIGRCHKSGTGNNQGLQRTTPRYKWGFERTFTQRGTSCHYRWYMFLLYWIIQSSIHISCPRFVNSHPGLHITLLVITSASIAITVTQRAMSCYHQWYLCFLHGMIQSLIQLSCPRFVNSHPALHRTLLMITGALIARAVT